MNKTISLSWEATTVSACSISSLQSLSSLLNFTSNLKSKNKFMKEFIIFYYRLLGLLTIKTITASLMIPSF